MIIAIEGCDRMGKTSLFQRLQRCYPAVYVGSVPFRRELMPVAELVEERGSDLWRQMYDPTKLYISDRVPWISGPVYSRVYGRVPRVYKEPWFNRTRVIYLAPEVGFRGYEVDPIADPTLLESTLRAYESILQMYLTRVITVPSAAMLKTALSTVHSWWHSWWRTA